MQKKNTEQEPSFKISAGETVTLFVEGQNTEILQHDSLQVTREDKTVLINKLADSIFDDLIKASGLAE